MNGPTECKESVHPWLILALSWLKVDRVNALRSLTLKRGLETRIEAYRSNLSMPITELAKHIYTNSARVGLTGVMGKPLSCNKKYEIVSSQESLF